MEIEDGRTDGWMEIEDERDGVTSIERKRKKRRTSVDGDRREQRDKKAGKNKNKTNE